MLHSHQERRVALRPSHDLHPANTTVTALIHFSYAHLPLVSEFDLLHSVPPGADARPRPASAREPERIHQGRALDEQTSGPRGLAAAGASGRTQEAGGARGWSDERKRARTASCSGGAVCPARGRTRRRSNWRNSSTTAAPEAIKTTTSSKSASS